MGSIAVASTFRKQSLEFPWTMDAVCHCIGYLLRPCTRICQIILSIGFVYPCGFRERPALIELELGYLAFDFHHIFLQLCIIAVAIAPKDICLTIVIDEDSRVDAHPVMICTLAVGLCKKGLSDSILVRTFRAVADGNAYTEPDPDYDASADRDTGADDGKARL